jgi:hypothetical protein
LPLGRKNTIIYFSSGSMRASRVHGSMAATWDAKDWFVLLRGKQYGPYTYAGLVRAAASGIVDPEAGVWCVGWDEWRIARDVPGLFEQEPELVPDDQEEVFDSPEGDNCGKSTTEEAATAVSAAPKPVAGRGSLELANRRSGSRDKNEVAVELDKAPSIDVSAELPSAPVPPQRKSPGHRGGLRLAVYSVLAVLLILFSAGWAAISLGIIRITIR